jgi:hypothetical protein
LALDGTPGWRVCRFVEQVGDPMLETDGPLHLATLALHSRHRDDAQVRHGMRLRLQDRFLLASPAGQPNGIP